MHQNITKNYEVPLTKPVDILHAVGAVMKKLGGNNADYWSINGNVVVAVSQDYSTPKGHMLVLSHKLLYYIYTDASESDHATNILQISPQELEIKPEDIKVLEDRLAA